MKNLPDKQTLLELLAMAKEADQKARATCEIVTEIAYKWQNRLEGRPSANYQEKASQLSD